ncbi:hypothetical protein D9758_005438 [Tetrapyrgos nigripes]|uniref:Velvet domain-containing protein n=1 Tax=Tetrapyrgos nigripes TaxID=182062 RepID=A0A8H5GIB7_9AGAR|nr:hypothetical protein D9758_005438 [Tetrapyrgos nigripes]
MSHTPSSTLGRTGSGAMEPTGMGHVGRPIFFTAGQFKGRTIRAELVEIQKADLGRKYARVDRRPLDPPPVIALHLYEVINDENNGETEYEINNVDEIQTHGLLCTVDLFPVVGLDSPHTSVPVSGHSPHSSQSSPSPQSTSSSPTHSSYPQSIHGDLPYIPIRSSDHVSFPSPQHYSRYHQSTQAAFNFSQNQNQPQSRYTQTNATASSSTSTPSPHGGLYTTLQFSTPPVQPETPHPSDIVHRVESVPITESSKMTNSLVGSTFVMPTTIEYQGKKTLLFVFSDLAVKSEGYFILRYRMFDLFSRALDMEDLVIQAECYGGMFRVYSTKEFPGLQASTELTKNLSRYGVRLNIRETERRRNKETGTDEFSTMPMSTSEGRSKRKHVGDDIGGYEDY